MGVAVVLIRQTAGYAGSGVKALLGGAVVGGLASFISPLVGFVALVGAVLYDVYQASAGEGTSRKRRQAGLMISLIPAAVTALFPARWMFEAVLLHRGLLWWEAALVSILAFTMVVGLGAVMGAMSPQRAVSCDSPI